MIKLDVGVCYNGAIGDCAVTIDLSGKYQGLIDAVEAALLAAERIIKVEFRCGRLAKSLRRPLHLMDFPRSKTYQVMGLGIIKFILRLLFPITMIDQVVLLRRG